jgi:hypothetical protein
MCSLVFCFRSERQLARRYGHVMSEEHDAQTIVRNLNGTNTDKSMGEMATARALRLIIVDAMVRSKRLGDPLGQLRFFSNSL